MCSCFRYDDFLILSVIIFVFAVVVLSTTVLIIYVDITCWKDTCRAYNVCSVLVKWNLGQEGPLSEIHVQL